MKKQFCHAFTLVEILVTISLIFVLASILFAVMGPARESGRRSVCMHNLHQWGLAFAMYRADYDGIDPDKGFGLTHAEMGLPPFSSVFWFEKAYKLAGTAVMWCPSTHSIPSNEHWATKYQTVGFLSEENGSQVKNITALHGTDFPLIVCDMHNIDIDFDHQPTWAVKNIQVLRLDQRVQYHSVHVRTSVTDE